VHSLIFCRRERPVQPQHNLLRRLSEEVIARAPFRQDVKKFVGTGYADSAENIAPATKVGVRHQADARPNDDLAGAWPRRGENFIECIIEKRGSRDEEDVSLRHDDRRLRSVAIEWHLIRLESCRILLQDQIRLAPPLQLAQKRNEGSYNDDRLARANARRVKGVNANFDVNIGMRPAVPTQGRQRIHGGDTDGTADSIVLLHLIQKSRGTPAAHFPGKRHGMCRAWATYGIWDRFDRRCASADLAR
jgi:hypothetical protein